MRKLLGPHLGGQWIENLETLREWQPPLVLLLQPEVSRVQRLREACPNTIIVGRFYHEDSWYNNNILARPKEFAAEIHDEIISNPVTPLLDYVQTNNETNQDWRGIQRLNQFTEKWMSLADGTGIYKCAILAFSAGNPDLPDKPNDPAGFDGRMLYWQQVLPSLNYAQRNGHILLLHAYGYPTMFNPDLNWYIYRYERQVEENLAALGIKDLRYAYGEIGIDRLLVGEKGGYKSITNDESYVNQLFQWERDLQGRPRLLGGAIFTFGDSGGWGSYDIASTEAAAMIAKRYQDNADKYGEVDGEGDSTKFTTNLPSIMNGKPDAPQVGLPPVVWDDRLTDRGVTTKALSVSPGMSFWRVAMARWYNKDEAGGRHHIYVEAPEGTEILVEWPDGDKFIKANSLSGFDAANHPMSGSLNEYSVRVADMNPSEVVAGIGMGADGNKNIHTATLVRFELVTQPEVDMPEATVHVPPLVHPIEDPALRSISQRFGENPQDYAKFGLAGHNGVDFRVPMDTPIHAVDDGEIVESATDEDGYGHYVRMRHDWGESLYAHLWVIRQIGTGPIRAGDQIGRSGNSGNSTGPHLHFAMRVNPYKRGYPYDGYVDPLPYLDGHAQPGGGTFTPLQAIKMAAKEFGLDWRLLASQAWAESSFDPKALSGAGARGLFQVMPATWDEWAPKIGATKPYDSLDSARVGAVYLRWLLTRTRGSEFEALVAYGWGIGNLLESANGVAGAPDMWLNYAAKVIHGRDLLAETE